MARKRDEATQLAGKALLEVGAIACRVHLQVDTQARGTRQGLATNVTLKWLDVEVRDTVLLEGGLVEETFATLLALELAHVVVVHLVHAQANASDVRLATGVAA